MVALLALLSALAFNEVNMQALEREAPEKVRGHATIRTADDESYLVPADNFHDKGVWKTNGNSTQDYLFRTPGYGILYLCCKWVAGENALYLLRYLQLLLYGLAVLLLFRSLELTAGKKTAVVLSLLYGFLPLTSGFIYCTLTEGISPVLVSSFIYFLTRYYKKEKGKNLLYAAIVLAVLLAVRPVFLFLSLVFVLEMFLPFYPRKKNEGFLWPLGYLLISFLLLGAWQFRNYMITGRLVSLHPVYMNDNRNIFRPSHKAMGEFFKCFTADGKLFHTCINNLWDNASNSDTGLAEIKKNMAMIPAWVKKDLDSVNLAQAFDRYRHNSYLVKLSIAGNRDIPETCMVAEVQHVMDFTGFRNKLARGHVWHTYVVMPIVSLKQMAVHSNLSLYVFQHTWRGHLLMEFLRWVCLFLHLALFIALPLLLLVKKDRFTWAMLILLGCYIGYLAVFQVMNEERYLLPVIPVMVMCLGALIKAVQSLRLKV